MDNFWNTVNLSDSFSLRERGKKMLHVVVWLKSSKVLCHSFHRDQGPMSSPLDLGRFMTASSWSTAEYFTELLRLGHKELGTFCLVLLEHLLSGSASSPGASQNPTTMQWGSPSYLERPHVGPPRIQFQLSPAFELPQPRSQTYEWRISKWFQSPGICVSADETPHIIKKRQVIILNLPYPHTWPREDRRAKLIISTDDGLFVCY